MQRRRFLKTAAGLFVPAACGIVRAQPFQLNDPALLAATRPKAQASYTAETASFTGGTQHLDRAGATATGTSQVGIMSFWLNPASFSVQSDIIRDVSVNSFMFRIKTDGTVRIEMGNTPMVDVTTTGALTAGAWNHVLIAWTLSTSVFQVYFNEVNASPSGTVLTTAIDYVWDTPSIPYVGAQAISYCLAEFYWTKATYLDISNSSNRALFSSGGHPVSLGANGSTPTGSQPIIYLRQGGSNWGINAGSTANFTATGTFGTCTAP